MKKSNRSSSKKIAHLSSDKDTIHLGGVTCLANKINEIIDAVNEIYDRFDAAAKLMTEAGMSPKRKDPRSEKTSNNKNNK